MFAAIQVSLTVSDGKGGISALNAWYALVVGPKPAMRLLALSPLRTACDLNFAVVPLFIVMGVLARNSGISANLFTAFRTCFGSVRGGLGQARIGACAGFSAVSGSAAFTVEFSP